MFVQKSIQFRQWWYKQTFVEQLKNPLGMLIFFCLAALVALAIKTGGILGGAGLLGVSIALPLVFGSMFNHQLGSVFMLIIGFSIQFITKYTSLPIGTSMDALLLLMMTGMLVQQIRLRDFSFARSPFTPWLLFWIAANVLQGLNPWAQSQMAWLYTVRSMAILAMLYFVACNAFSSKKRIIWMLNFVFFLGFLAAVWGWKQEFFGFTDAERIWLYSDEKRFELIFQWTRYRIFSILNDPTTFGIMMAYMAVMVFILAFGKGKTSVQVFWLVLMGIVMTAANSFTGTRTSFVLVPIGFIMFLVLNPSKPVLIATAIFFLFGTAFIMKGSSNALIFRIQSAFRPTNDESMLVRIKNQAFIQPSIQSHPIGFGLGSCGEWGKRFSPNHWLSSFPHDSGYVRIAIELGWLGLILYLIFLVILLKTSIYYYFRVKDPTIKNYYLSLTVGVFILMVANYPQEAIVQLPTSLVFYIFMAAIARLKDFDPAFAVTDENTDLGVPAA